MSDIWLITGGCRSGKSMYAEELSKEKSASEEKKGAKGRSGVLYIATGVAMDEEMEERIMIHRERRPEEWITWERYQGLDEIEDQFEINDFGTIMLDCIGNMLMGILFDEEPDADVCTEKQFTEAEKTAEAEIDALCDYAAKYDKRLIFVTNEIGMGVVPDTRYSRHFRDSLGRVNIHTGKVADKVVLMTSGLPITLK